MILNLTLKHFQNKFLLINCDNCCEKTQPCAVVLYMAIYTYKPFILFFIILFKNDSLL